jgi:AcrR family transcriptional regulator
MPEVVTGYGRRMVGFRNGFSASGQRGVPDHTVREQIIAAANDHFTHCGYGKTTVSDLALHLQVFWV